MLPPGHGQPAAIQGAAVTTARGFPWGGPAVLGVPRSPVCRAYDVDEFRAAASAGAASLRGAGQAWLATGRAPRPLFPPT